jgi:methionyl-tRNA formyltransferase
MSVKTMSVKTMPAKTIPVRIVFMGTPDFAVPPLQALIESAAQKDWQVVAVVTQPDRPQGRGKKLASSPVKVVAEAAGLTLWQPATLKTEAAIEHLAALQPDVVIVAAFGQILRKNVLDMPPYGCLNIHASLLPRWRGAAPITAAIRAGDTETGITLMKMDEGLDTGAIIAQRSLPILPTHTGGTLTAELAQVGASLLLDTLPGWLAGKITPRPQNDALATLATRLKKEEGVIDWSQPAAAIERQVRAFQPWPGTFTQGTRGPLKIIAVDLAAGVSPPAGNKPGTVFTQQREVYVSTGEGVIHLQTVQPAGKKPMAAAALLNGQPDLLGAQLGQPAAF